MKSIRDRYPSHVPVIVEKGTGCDIGELPKKKYLVLNEISVGAFTFVLRKYLRLESHEGLFLYTTDNVLAPCTMSVRELVGDNEFLHLYYTGENVFGSTSTCGLHRIFYV